MTSKQTTIQLEEHDRKCKAIQIRFNLIYSMSSITKQKVKYLKNNTDFLSFFFFNYKTKTCTILSINLTIVKYFIENSVFLLIYLMQSYLRRSHICGLIVNVMKLAMFLSPIVVVHHHDHASN